MKNGQFKNVLEKNFWSIIVLAIIVFVAAGSDISKTVVKEELLKHPSGLYEKNVKYVSGNTSTSTGYRDKKGRWKGWIVKEEFRPSIYPPYKELIWKETAFYYEGGIRHGESTIVKASGETTTVCYDMGNRIDCQKSAGSGTVESSAFEIFQYNYPWLILSLNGFDFSNSHIQSYIDTIESVLTGFQFQSTQFEYFYQDAISNIEGNGYDSLMNINGMFSSFNGLDIMKNNEFRLAVIDRFLKGKTNTFYEVRDFYPGYLLSLNDSGIIAADFENFCFKFDSIFAGFGAIDIEDPFFPDTVDARMLRSVLAVADLGSSSSSSSLIALKSATLKNKTIQGYGLLKMARMYFKRGTATAPEDVAGIMILIMLQEYLSGDLIKESVKESYFNKKGIAVLPTVTTVFSENNSSTSVTISGNVIENGGTNVTQRGVVWATTNNPTVNQNKTSSGNGLGSFAATITGLIEGETYNARAFATNSVGTVYGNNVRFVASQNTNIEDEIDLNKSFKVFPNPASSVVNFEIMGGVSENIYLTLININGQVVYQQNISSLKTSNHFQLDVSHFQTGIYNCIVTFSGQKSVNRKLLVTH